MAIQEEIFPDVTLRNPTPDELKRSTLPDDSLRSIWIEFTIKGPHLIIDPEPRTLHFRVAHNTADPSYNNSDPYILLSGGPITVHPSVSSSLDIIYFRDYFLPFFKSVRETVAREANGKPEDNILRGNGTISDVIGLIEQPTQRSVAELIKGYRIFFDDVRIPVAYFGDVPKWKYYSSGFLLAKLTPT